MGRVVCVHFPWRGEGIEDSASLVQTLESLPVSSAGQEQDQVSERESCQQGRLGRAQQEGEPDVKIQKTIIITTY